LRYINIYTYTSIGIAPSHGRCDRSASELVSRAQGITHSGAGGEPASLAASRAPLARRVDENK